jgi:hypothetical protein
MIKSKTLFLLTFRLMDWFASVSRVLMRFILGWNGLKLKFLGRKNITLFFWQPQWWPECRLVDDTMLALTGNMAFTHFLKNFIHPLKKVIPSPHTCQGLMAHPHAWAFRCNGLGMLGHRLLWLGFFLPIFFFIYIYIYIYIYRLNINSEKKIIELGRVYDPNHKFDELNHNS